MSQVETHHLTASDLGGSKGFLDWLKDTTSGLNEVAQTVWGTINTFDKPADNVTPGPKPNQSGTQQLSLSPETKKLLVTGALLVAGATVVILIAKRK